MRYPERVTVTEVGPRDGLQNEAETISLEQKIALIDRLSVTGLTRIEAASFVSPKAIPQMANAAEVMAGVERPPGVTYIGLVPNETGARNAIEARVDEITVVISASPSHNKANINRTIGETRAEIRKVAALAAETGIPWTGYVSTAFGCPYEGAVDPGRVIALAEEMMSIGAREIALGDTIGIANPRQAFDLTTQFFSELPGTPLRLHFHDTRGMALANVVAAMEAGAMQFDCSIGGLGGCPYAPGASGNVATEDLAAMLAAMGIKTGIDLDALLDAAWFAEEIVGRPLEGRVKRALGRSRRD
ncbi:MAG: hydroxymethylglutaryl-CoA lyase [Dehalococcoidia bacterium]